MKNILKNIIIILTSIITLFILSACANENNKKTSDINYEIITDKNFANPLQVSNKTDRGYEIIEQDDFYYLVIRYGEENVYFSKLDVTKVEVDGKNIKVWVKLPETEGIGEAFSYPNAIIKLDEKPEKVKVVYK